VLQGDFVNIPMGFLDCYEFFGIIGLEYNAVLIRLNNTGGLCRRNITETGSFIGSEMFYENPRGKNTASHRIMTNSRL
jgi:hypothetical protein